MRVGVGVRVRVRVWVRVRVRSTLSGTCVCVSSGTPCGLMRLISGGRSPSKKVKGKVSTTRP